MTKSDESGVPPIYAAVAIAILCVLAIWPITRLELDNRLNRLLNPEGKAAQEFAKFEEEFGGDQFVVVAVSGKPLFAEDGLVAMVETLEQLEEIPEVANVSGIPAVFRDQFGLEDIDAMEEELTSTPFYYGLFLSPAKSMAGILVELEEPDEPGATGRIVRAIRATAAPLEEYGYRVDFVGQPINRYEINQLSKNESLRTFPLAAAASLVVLLLLLRSVRTASVVVVCGGLSLVLTLGFIGLLGRPLNVVTMSLPLVMWVLSIANCIHVVTRFQHYRIHRPTVRAAVGAALLETRYPCALSALTTAFGFYSLVTAKVEPVQEFGIYMGTGMIISLLVNLILAPYLLILLRARAPRWRRSENAGHIFGVVGNQVVRFRWAVIGLFACIVVGGILSIPYLKSEPDSAKFLPEDSEGAIAIRHVTKNLTGINSLEILVDLPGPWTTAEYWPILERLANKYEQREIVPRVVTPLDFLKKINQWENDLDPAYYRLPDTTEEAEELVSMLSEEDAPGLQRLVKRDGARIRMSVMTSSQKTNDYLALADEAKQDLAALPEGFSGVVTGTAYRMRTMQMNLMETQFRSFGAAFLMVFICIWVGLRSFRIVAVSVVPNVMPVLSVFAVMVLFEISLDAATVMVASIALGIAVDDAVHLLNAYRRERDQHKEVREAIRHALEAVGPSITVTTVTACIGFFTLGTSQFGPIANFGNLSGIAMAMALITDMLFVPAVVSFRRSQKESL